MAKIIFRDELVAEPETDRGLIWGKPGSGKTWLGLTGALQELILAEKENRKPLPFIVIETEGGVKKLLKDPIFKDCHHIGVIPTFDWHSFTDAVKIALTTLGFQIKMDEHLRPIEIIRGRGHLMVDSMTDPWTWVQAMWKKDILKVDEAFELKPIGYAPINQLFLRVMKSLFNIDGQVIFTANARNIYENKVYDKNKGQWVRDAFNPSGQEPHTMKKVPYNVDYIYQMYTAIPPGKDQLQHFALIEKDRDKNQAGMTIKNPNMPRIYKWKDEIERRQLEDFDVKRLGQ